MLRTADQENERVRARIDRLVNRLPCLVYRCRIDPGERMDSDYRMTLEYVSRGSQDLLGISEKNMVENAWNTLERMTHPADLQGVRKAVYDSIVTHTPYEKMYRLRLPDGTRKWVWDQGEAVYDEHGAPIYFEGLLMDVSGQKFTEIALKEENERLKMGMDSAERMGAIVGKSEAMHRVYNLIMKAAETDANVIIYGETGCGKDMVARAIHNYSGRKGAYVPVNCGAIPENLLESEFFGYARGAFTGATGSKEGFVAAANNGTLFLDEVGELPMHLQVKFLRVLESKSYTPLGTTVPRQSSFRLVSATNRDMRSMVREGKVRADFYYRVNVLEIKLPPLRERREDIPLLVKSWSERNGVNLSLPHEVRIAMNHYEWPGNVRELQNFLDRYATFGRSAADALNGADQIIPPVTEGLTLAEATQKLEEKMIFRALEKCHWHRGRTADALGLNLRTLQRKMKNLGITVGEK